MEQMNILLIGKTGHGKSRTGNTILEEQHFGVHHGSSSGTTECKAERKIINGRNIKIIDSPGLFDTELEERHKPEIFRCIAECSPGIHAFVIVLKAAKYTVHEIEVVKKITDMLGEEVVKYAVVLFTNVEQLEDYPIETFVEENENLRKLVKKCGSRYHMVDNRYWNQEHEYKSNRVQVEKLLNTIDEMVRQNRGAYTNEMLQKAENAIRAEMEDIRSKNSSDNMTEEDIRKAATDRVVNTFVRKSAGVVAGVFTGALVGIGMAGVALVFATITVGKCVVKLVGQSAKDDKVSAAAVGTAGVIGVPIGTALATCATGVLAPLSAVAYAALGGMAGAEAAEDAQTVGEAMKKAFRVNIENAKTIINALNLEPEVPEEMSPLAPGEEMPSLEPEEDIPSLEQ